MDCTFVGRKWCEVHVICKPLLPQRLEKREVVTPEPQGSPSLHPSSARVLFSGQARAPRMFGKKQASVRKFLLAFGTALLIPVLAFAAVLIGNYAKSERAQFERQAEVAAHNL